MKIQLIGTGSIGAKERSACSLINDELLIDLGNGNIKGFKQLGNEILNLKAIFITHLHGDHFADIPFLILDRMILQNTIQEDLTIYGPEQLEDKVRILHNIFFGDYERCKATARIKFEKVEENKKYNVYDYEISTLLVDHETIKPAFGYIVKHGDKKIGFSGDSIYCDAIDEIVKNSDLAVLDMSTPKKVMGHMGLDDLACICEKYPDKKIIATHMHENTRKLAKEQNIKNLIIPGDGFTLEI